MSSEEPLFQAKPATLWNNMELQPYVWGKKKPNIHLYLYHKVKTQRSKYRQKSLQTMISEKTIPSHFQSSQTTKMTPRLRGGLGSTIKSSPWFQPPMLQTGPAPWRKEPPGEGELQFTQFILSLLIKRQRGSNRMAEISPFSAVSLKLELRDQGHPKCVVTQTWVRGFDLVHGVRASPPSSPISKAHPDGSSGLCWQEGGCWVLLIFNFFSC